MASMQALRATCLFKLAFVKYDAREDGNPAAERKDSISCMVMTNMTWPVDNDRISLVRTGM